MSITTSGSSLHEYQTKRSLKMASVLLLFGLVMFSTGWSAGQENQDWTCDFSTNNCNITQYRFGQPKWIWSLDGGYYEANFQEPINIGVKRTCFLPTEAQLNPGAMTFAFYSNGFGNLEVRVCTADMEVFSGTGWNIAEVNILCRRTSKISFTAVKDNSSNPQIRIDNITVIAGLQLSPVSTIGSQSTLAVSTQSLTTGSHSIATSSATDFHSTVMSSTSSSTTGSHSTSKFSTTRSHSTSSSSTMGSRSTLPPYSTTTILNTDSHSTSPYTTSDALSTSLLYTPDVKSTLNVTVDAVTTSEVETTEVSMVSSFTTPTTTESGGGQSGGVNLAVVIPISVVIFLLIFILVTAVCMHCRHRRKSRKELSSHEEDAKQNIYSNPAFSTEENELSLNQNGVQNKTVDKYNDVEIGKPNENNVQQSQSDDVHINVESSRGSIDEETPVYSVLEQTDGSHDPGEQSTVTPTIICDDDTYEDPDKLGNATETHGGNGHGAMAVLDDEEEYSSLVHGESVKGKNPPKQNGGKGVGDNEYGTLNVDEEYSTLDHGISTKGKNPSKQNGVQGVGDNEYGTLNVDEEYSTLVHGVSTMGKNPSNQNGGQVVADNEYGTLDVDNTTNQRPSDIVDDNVYNVLDGETTAGYFEDIGEDTPKIGVAGAVAAAASLRAGGRGGGSRAEQNAQPISVRHPSDMYETIDFIRDENPSNIGAAEKQGVGNDKHQTPYPKNATSVLSPIIPNGNVYNVLEMGTNVGKVEGKDKDMAKNGVAGAVAVGAVVGKGGVEKGDNIYIRRPSDAYDVIDFNGVLKPTTTGAPKESDAFYGSAEYNLLQPSKQVGDQSHGDGGRVGVTEEASLEDEGDEYYAVVN